MRMPGVIDEHFLGRYRALLDAEDMAFDELEHAYEEGDRTAFEADLKVWRTAISRRMSFLEQVGLHTAPMPRQQVG